MKQAPRIEEILSAPLIAAAKANTEMLKEQTRFIMEICFEMNPDNTYKPRMVELLLSDGSSFEVPIITLIPLNSLAVDNVDIDFSLEIISQINNTHKESMSLNDGDKERAKTSLSGRLSYDSNDTKSARSHNSSKLNVKINAKSIPIPTGVTTLIDIYLKSISNKVEKS